MHKTLTLPFGIDLDVTPYGAGITASRLEREFYVPTLHARNESNGVSLVLQFPRLREV